jgi:hypothetical protein
MERVYDVVINGQMYVGLTADDIYDIIEDCLDFADVDEVLDIQVSAITID